MIYRAVICSKYIHNEHSGKHVTVGAHVSAKRRGKEAWPMEWGVANLNGWGWDGVTEAGLGGGGGLLITK
jgi:hypothetical protein